MEPPFFTKNQIKKDFQKIGVQAGQIVMLHVSVKAIGWVVGGPNVVLDALLEVLSPKGTLMMMVGWEDYPYDLPKWSKEKQAAYLEECPAYKPHTSRANREFSILTEYFRTYSTEVFRSAHPSSSCAATGLHAKYLTELHSFKYGFGENSPFGRFYELGGKILNIGAPLDTLTMLHHAEHLCQVPNKRIDYFKMPVLINEKRQWTQIEEFDSSLGIYDWQGEDYFELIANGFIKQEKIQPGKIGIARSYLFDARKLVDFGVNWMEQHFV